MPIRPPMMSNAILISMLRYYRKSFLTYFPIPSNVHSSGIYNLGMNDIIYRPRKLKICLSKKVHT